MKRVLIVTHSEDNEVVERVTHALAERDALAFRLDTDLYPQDCRMSVEYSSSGAMLRTLDVGGEVLDLNEVHSVWYRRFRAGERLSPALGPYHEAAVTEARQTLYGAIASLDCLQVDSLMNVRLADSKELQLKLAAKVGLAIPATLITNDAVRAQAWAKTLPGKLVCKMQTTTAVRKEGRDHVVFTSTIDPSESDAFAGLHLAPMIFQEAIDKHIEVRATVVGKTVLSACIDTRGMDNAEVDWRRERGTLMRQWQPYTLPESVSQSLLALTQRFGLKYAAADFLVTKDGRHLFLEINASGEWLWLAQSPGLRIADAIAQVLTQ